LSFRALAAILMLQCIIGGETAVWANGTSERGTTLRDRSADPGKGQPSRAATYEELLIQSHPTRMRGAMPRPSRDSSAAAIRVLDVCISIALLAFLAPLMALIALAVFVFDPGPVIFAHRRVGRSGTPFHCYKFRSMYLGAEERLQAVLAADPARRAEWIRDQKLSDDPRVTRLGSVLRITSLDELPQLVNVLKGEMSLVGPRPIVQAEVARYGRFIAAYYSVKPGLTGLWQVTGRSNTTYRRRVASDVFYARSRSMVLDLRILAATVPAVIAARGSA
jgi:lipopolysaccharide/colanic/teichoic acid biosynthesis glycosyltransferase